MPRPSKGRKEHKVHLWCTDEEWDALSAFILSGPATPVPAPPVPAPPVPVAKVPRERVQVKQGLMSAWKFRDPETGILYDSPK